MANPFTKPILSGYNQNPPDDDGSQVADNLVEWQKHIDKIGDPIKNYASTIANRVEAAFNNIFGNSIKEITTDITLTEADQGQVVFASNSPITVTLPSASDVGTNWVVVIANEETIIGDSSSNNITITPPGSETINGESSIDLIPQTYALVVSNGVNFRAIRTFTESLRQPFLDSTSSVAFDVWITPSTERSSTVCVQCTAETNSVVEGRIDVLLDPGANGAAAKTFRICRVSDSRQDGEQDTGCFTFPLPPNGKYKIQNTNDPNNANTVDEVAEFIH